MESAHGFDRLSRRMCVRFTGMETYRLLYDRLSAVWSAVRVCRHGWFDSKGGFCIPVAQVMEQRSPKPQAAGLIPAGNARLDVRAGDAGASV